jgi:hypothetical protein
MHGQPIKLNDERKETSPAQSPHFSFLASAERFSVASFFPAG